MPPATGHKHRALESQLGTIQTQLLTGAHRSTCNHINVFLTSACTSTCQQQGLYGLELPLQGPGFKSCCLVDAEEGWRPLTEGFTAKFVVLPMCTRDVILETDFLSDNRAITDLHQVMI